MNPKHRRRIQQALIFSLLAFALIWTLYPIWWAVALSFKRPPDFFTAKALPFLQFRPTLDNWRTEWRAFGDPAGMGRSLLGSTIVASGSSILALGLGVPAAYGLRLTQRYRIALWLLIFFLLPRLVPPALIVFPYSRLMAWLGLGDTWLALAIAHATLTLPFAILISYAALRDFPAEIFDAALVDGCRHLRLLWSIILPILAPVILATVALCFAFSWNEFLFALLNVQQIAQTVPLAVASLVTKDGIEFEYVGSHLVMVIVPPLLLALLANRVLVRGLTFGLIRDDRSSDETGAPAMRN